eukprot:SAG31_NODE_2336_length_5921_cov_33.442288_3_plen_40_part_00
MQCDPSSEHWDGYCGGKTFIDIDMNIGLSQHMMFLLHIR